MTAIVGILNGNKKRHIISSEESVGGPIDVAVITKTDGFKWVKQKVAT